MRNLVHLMRSLGGSVRYHRRKAGLTQIQLADLAGVGKATVYDIEKGKSSIQIDSLFAVLSVLNIEMSFSGPLEACVDNRSADADADTRGAESGNG